MKKIGITGAHGSGKSTLTFKLAMLLKQRGSNVDIVQERIRYCPFPFNADMVIETAMWAYHAQVRRELEAKAAGFDTVVCDRTSLDAFIYAEYRNINSPMLTRFRKSAEMWLTTYDKIIWINPDTELKDDGIRDTDKEFQKGIDYIFRQTLPVLRETFMLDIIETSTTEILNNNFDYERAL